MESTATNFHNKVSGTEYLPLAVQREEKPINPFVARVPINKSMFMSSEHKKSGSWILWA